MEKIINIAALLSYYKAEFNQNNKIEKNNITKNKIAFYFDLEILLANVLGVDRGYLHTWPEKIVEPEKQQQFEAFVKRRLQGEPIAYIIGTKEFWSLVFEVSPAVLIPRPETELLVQFILDYFPYSKESKNAVEDINAVVNILELGTGSGAIALSLGFERPNWQILALEKSEAALVVAKKNAKRLNIENVQFFKGDYYQDDWFSDFLGFSESSEFQKSSDFINAFDVIVANPPYLAPDDQHLKEKESDIRFEPIEALVSAPDGLRDFRQIIGKAAAYLKPGGLLLLEHGFDQGAALVALMQKQGFVEVEDFQDLAGLSRMIKGIKK